MAVLRRSMWFGAMRPCCKRSGYSRRVVWRPGAFDLLGGRSFGPFVKMALCVLWGFTAIFLHCWRSQAGRGPSGVAAGRSMDQLGAVRSDLIGARSWVWRQLSGLLCSALKLGRVVWSADGVKRFGVFGLLVCCWCGRVWSGARFGFSGVMLTCGFWRDF